MNYLKAALELKKLIRKVNHLQLQKELTVLAHCNSMFLFNGEKLLAEVCMKSYTNDFVAETLAEYPETTAFVMTDLASTMVKEHKITYWLYKAYHVGVEKGMVYYQPIEEQSLQKTGRLQYSNMETNIFLKHVAPEGEESSANAMETDEQVEGGKNIVFLVGHMNEDRLLYDLQRLILDSTSNVQQHKSVDFKFILNISVFNSKPSESFRQRVEQLERFTHDEFITDYPNVQIVFELEQ